MTIFIWRARRHGLDAFILVIVIFVRVVIDDEK